VRLQHRIRRGRMPTGSQTQIPPFSSFALVLAPSLSSPSYPLIHNNTSMGSAHRCKIPRLLRGGIPWARQGSPCRSKLHARNVGRAAPATCPLCEHWPAKATECPLVIVLI
jgi:hypothetical protein